MPGQGEDSAPDHQAIREVLSRLQRAYKERRMYPPDHPSSRASVASFITCLTEYLSAHESLSLTVGEASLRSEGTEVYAGSEAGKENLAFLMFGDGIRIVVFNPGLDDDEITAFIDCLARADGFDRDDHDLATLLWEADLSHIDYAVADPFSGGDHLAKDTVKNLSDLVIGKLNALCLPLDDTQPEVATSVAEAEGSAVLRDFVLSVNEQAELDDLARQKPELASEFRNVLLDVVAGAPAAHTAERASRAYAALLGPSLREGKTREAEEALGHLSAALQDNPAKEGLLRAAVSATAEAGDLGGTLALLESAEAGDRTRAQHFLGRIAPWAFATLLRRLTETESTGARKSLLTILANVQPPPVSLLADQLRDERWFVVRNSVCLLAGARDDPEALGLLARTASYPDVRVRRETVRALSGFVDPRAAVLLAQSMHDDDPSVRILATRALAGLDAPACLGDLERIVSDKSFCHRTTEEVAEFLSTYADIAKDGAIPLLDRMWRKKYLRRNRPLELRVAAVSALARVPSDSARRSLRDAARAREPAISHTARRFLSDTAPEGTAGRE